MNTNLFFSVIMFLSLGAVYSMPARLNNNHEPQNGSSQASTNVFRYSTFFKNKYSLLALLARLLSTLCYWFLDPILGLQLVELGMNDNNTGFVFALYSATWAIGSPVVGYICQYVNRRVVILVSFLLLAVSLLFVGPSVILGLQPSIPMALVSLSFLGLSVAGCYVPLVSEIVEAIETEESQRDQVADKISVLFCMLTALGSFLGPLSAGAITDATSFRFTTDVFALIAFVFALIYFLMSVIPTYFLKDPATKGKLQSSDDRHRRN